MLHCEGEAHQFALIGIGAGGFGIKANAFVLFKYADQLGAFFECIG
jgi:hypothetical protein